MISRRNFLTALGVGGPVAFAGGCATFGRDSRNIRVGITPDYAPMAFRQGPHLAGVEVDLALEVGRRMKKKIQFVMLRWEEQIPALLEGKTDIIMSGMSVSDARKLRIDFTDPYFTTGLMTLMRWKDSTKYRTAEDIMACTGRVGVKAGTQAGRYLDQKMLYARKALYEIPADGALHLRQGRIDLFIHDGPAIAWLASENETSLTGLFLPLTVEFLAWGVRRNDPLRDTMNIVLAEMRGDGFLESVLQHWMPWIDKVRKVAG